MSVASINETIEYLKCTEIDDSHGVHPGLKQVMEDIFKLIDNVEIDQGQCLKFTEAIMDCILFTRDIKAGRGLQKLAFSYLYTFQQYFQMKAIFVLYMFVNSETDHQIGSWRDIREYCEFIATHSKLGRFDTIIKPIIGMYNNQIIKDYNLLERTLNEADTNSIVTDANAVVANAIDRPLIKNLSFAALWAPRNKLKHRWLFDTLVQMWIYMSPECREIMSSSDDKTAAYNVCKKKYQTIITKLSRELDR